MKVWMRTAQVLFLVSAASTAARAQSGSIPIKPGLWEIQSSSSRANALPPDAEARIAAMPAAQQAQVRAMMANGAGGGQPISTTRQVCYTQATLDSFANQAQQQSPGMQCTISNKTQSASGASFDITCTGPQGNAKGHDDIRLTDDEHFGSKTHMAMTGSSQGHTMNLTVDVTSTGKFLNANCGDVKPFSPLAPPK
jgi:hypothetical protein